MALHCAGDLINRRICDALPKPLGLVDLAPFACTDTPRSSFIRRVCYDKAKSYMVIKLKDVWYHYCSIPEGTVTALLGADSAGKYFNDNVKGRYGCRQNPVPSY
jgi:KTSC domain